MENTTKESSKLMTDGFLSSIDLDGPSNLTQLMGNVQWGKILPIDLTSEIRLHYASFEEVEKFTQANKEVLYGDGKKEYAFLKCNAPLARERYYSRLADCFFYKDYSGQTVGMTTAITTDWNSYYLRSGFVVPEFQGKGIIIMFVKKISEVLKEHGYERVTVEIVPTNKVSVHLYTRLGFYITNLALSERWGATVQFTKFLTSEAEQVFLKQFCAT